MENKIDQFFKDKLEGHTLPVSEEAWAKVEADLSKKNNVAIWRIAAAILIAGALVSIIIWSQQSNKRNQLNLATKKSVQEYSGKEKPASQIPAVEKKEATNASLKKSSVTPIEPRSIRKEESAIQTSTPEQLTIMNSTVSTQESVAINEKDKTIENIKSEATPATTIASTHQKPIKLEFTLENFSSQQPVAKVVNESKSTGLKKVWELALEVKNGDGPVHEIKNEIFALNFKKNKNQ